MATEKTSDAQALAKVRIPAEYLASLDRLFGSLRRRILHEATAQAATRTVGDEAGVVTREGFLRSAKGVFPVGPSEIEQALARQVQPSDSRACRHKTAADS